MCKYPTGNKLGLQTNKKKATQEPQGDIPFPGKL